ncbi:MAG: DUF2064 domain-containing protein [Fodinibius sp.]|nr:DUF2064 domain-containing protein [Fodinibius sp.]
MQNTAILFFSRSAHAESGYKQFVTDRQKNSCIAHSLIRHTLRQAEQTGLPVFHIDEQQQQGTTFGARFTNAFAQIFARGYDYVISIGNDIPELQSHHITKAARQLTSGQTDAVLGPDADGGTWLMGYSRAAFSADTFRKLPWQSSRLLDTIIEQRSDIAIHQLELLADIDNAREFNALFERPMAN